MIFNNNPHLQTQSISIPGWIAKIPYVDIIIVTDFFNSVINIIRRFLFVNHRSQMRKCQITLNLSWLFRFSLGLMPEFDLTSGWFCFGHIFVPLSFSSDSVPRDRRSLLTLLLFQILSFLFLLNVPYPNAWFVGKAVSFP